MPRPLRQTLPLPRGWPRRVRSAAVHAISLAQFALTCAHARDTRSRDTGDRRAARQGGEQLLRVPVRRANDWSGVLRIASLLPGWGARL